MRKLITKPVWLGLLLFICMASGAWAANPCPAYVAGTDCLELVNAGASYAMGGVYTSPYGIDILSNNGTPVNNPTTSLMICDDFSTDISFGQTWNATATTFAELQAGTNPNGTPKWCLNGSTPVQCTQGSNGPANLEGYAVAAVLAAELMTLPDAPNTSAFYNETAGEISFALWGVFDPGLLTSTAANPLGNDQFGSLTQAEFDAANSYLAGAESLVAGATSGGQINLGSIVVNTNYLITGLTIYTPNPLNASQEFLQVSVTPMPEPGYWSVLVLDLLAVAALMVFFRRHIVGLFN